jgi:hypothetical protein
VDHVVKVYSSTTSTTVLRKHLYKDHLVEWVNSCDKLQITINGKEAIKCAMEYRLKRDGPAASIPTDDQSPKGERVPFSKEAFLDALTDFIVADDMVSAQCYLPITLFIHNVCLQPISITKSTKLRNIFLLLCEDLDDKDIPKRTKLWEHIMDRF